MLDINERENSSRSSVCKIPPDLNDPPKNIPLKSLYDRYQLIEELGNGSFGCVTLAKAKFDLINLSSNVHQCKGTLLDQTNTEYQNFIAKSQRLVAIKTMLTKLYTLHDYTRVREVKFILALPTNKHLIQIFEIFADTSNYQLHIVMECMEQNLYQMMLHRKKRVFSIPSLKSILAQILAGIKHIHDHNFFHRDIKPENILVSPNKRYFDKERLELGFYPDNYVVKLADFGLARHVENKNTYTAYVSTRWYRSPEILLRNGYYSTPLDIWAFGCVAVEATIFKPLFPGSNELDQIWRILEVLGTPYNNKNDSTVPNNFKPYGGTWNHVAELASKLNLEFPFVEGISLDRFIPLPELYDLLDVIKKCLRWNPLERASANDLCLMEYFKDTVASESMKNSNTKGESRKDVTVKNNRVTTNTEQASFNICRYQF